LRAARATHNTFSGLRALDKDDVVQTRTSLIGIQELLLTHTPSSFVVSHSDDSDTSVTALAHAHLARGSDAPFVATLEQLLNSHSDVVSDVLASGAVMLVVVVMIMMINDDDDDYG